MSCRQFLPFIIAFVVLAGCGSHSRSATTTASGDPVAVYRARVNMICATRNKEMEAADNGGAQKAFIKRLAALQIATITEIRSTAPPSSISSSVSSWLLSADEAATAIARWSRNLADSESEVAYGQYARRAFAQAKALGLSSCAVVGAI